MNLFQSYYPNLIINGAMDLSQRGIGTIAIDDTVQYTLDRFIVKTSGGLTSGTCERSNTTVPSNNKSAYATLITATPTLVGHNLDVQQRIESIFSTAVYNAAVSFGCWVYSESATQLALTLSYANALNDFSTVTQISTVSKTISLGAWQYVVFENIQLSGGVQYGLEVSVSFQNMSVLSSSVNHYITQIKLNPGEVAQEFSRAGRDYMDETRLAQRYFEKSYDLDVDPGTASTLEGSVVGIASSTAGYIGLRWREIKRNTPIVTIYSPNTGASGYMYQESAPGDISGTIQNIGTSGASVVNGPSAVSDTRFDVHFTADAEL